MFILDSSSSEGSDNFHKQLDFVTNFARQFDIGPSSVQIGLITFASTAHNEFYLKAYVLNILEFLLIREFYPKYEIVNQ